MASNNKNVVDMPLSRKPSVKRKLPVIKQTKTSMYRMVRANPLLLLDKDKLNDLCLKKVQSSSCKLDPSGNKLKPNAVELKPILKSTNGSNKPSLKSTRLNKNDQKASTSTNNRQETKVNEENTALLEPLKTTSNRVSLSSMYRKNLIAGQNCKIVTKSVYTHFRRSLSAERFNETSFLMRSRSEIIQSSDDLCSDLLLDANLSPIREDKKLVTFKTPTAYNRRSVTIHTPVSLRRSFRIACTSTPGPQCSLNDFQKKFNNWLKLKGKSIGSYHHLKCFMDKDQTLTNEPDFDENKENIEEIVDLGRNESYENLGIVNEEQTLTEMASKNLGNVIKEQNINEAICKAALSDLHKLIQDGYPQNECEILLDKIWKRYMCLDETPQYWECRASLEQAKGNIASAVECYKTAIVKGAEVQTVDESLDQLLQKFSLLNISTASSADKDEKRTKIILDARNVFKSSIIKFAIQEKRMKQ